MNRMLPGLLLLAAVSAACGTESTDRQPDPAPSQPATTQPATTKPTQPPAANGTDLTSCARGNCEVKIVGTQTIPDTGPADFGAVTVTPEENAALIDFGRYSMQVIAGSGVGPDNASIVVVYSSGNTAVVKIRSH
ncbi:hypothetical protein DMP23_21120 [Amycolatopsis sp. A1MSW2902]